MSLIVATQMLSVAVGWQVYEITGKALALGFSGLALFLPGFLLALPGGHVADRRDRRKILLVCHLGVAACARAPRDRSRSAGARSLLPIYAVLALLGTIRAFSGPAGQALMPNLVERKDLERAVALGSSSWQLAMIAGPSLGGALYAATGRAGVVYAACTVMALVAFGVGARDRQAADARPRRASASRRRGARCSRACATCGRTSPILGAISLDLFAVLLGGAVALLPIFARDLLHIGPWGLGILRSAPAFGAATVAFLLAHFPLRRRAGVIMLACVLLFGLATIVFGISKSFAVSLVALARARRLRHDQRRRALDAHPDADARRDARPRRRSEHGVHRRIERARRVRVGRHRGVARARRRRCSSAASARASSSCCWALMFPSLRKVDRLDE